MTCAVCDGTNATTRLCAKCKADPANQDWHESDTRIVDDVEQLAAGERHADLLDKRARLPTLLQSAIVRDACVLVPVPYYDKLGHRHRRYRALDTYAIARRQNCAQSHVWRTIAKYTGQAS